MKTRLECWEGVTKTQKADAKRVKDKVIDELLRKLKKWGFDLDRMTRITVMVEQCSGGIAPVFQSAAIIRIRRNPSYVDIPYFSFDTQGNIIEVSNPLVKVSEL